MSKGQYNVYKVTAMNNLQIPEDTYIGYCAGVSPLCVFVGTNEDYHKRIVSIECIERNIGLQAIIHHKLGMSYVRANDKVICNYAPHNRA